MRHMPQLRKNATGEHVQINRAVWLIVGIAILAVLVVVCCIKLAQPPEEAEPQASAFTSLAEFESRRLAGQEFAGHEFASIEISAGICYIAYDPAFPGVKILILQNTADGQYEIAAETVKIGFTYAQQDPEQKLVTEFWMDDYGLKFLFSPNALGALTDYQEIAFSNAYVYLRQE